MLKKITKFSIVGALGTLTNMAVFGTLIFLSVNHNIAAMAAFAVAVSQNFLFNHKWTFRDHGKSYKRKFIKYIMLNLVGFVVNITVLNAIVGLVDHNQSLRDMLAIENEKTLLMLAQFIAIGSAMAFNFLGSHVLVFKKKEGDICLKP